MKPHKWAKEIKAWADGAEIEVKDIRSDWWTIQNPQWLESGDVEYRIKTQPKEDLEKEHYRKMAEKALAIPEISEALDRLIDAFSEKEPQYLYVYYDKNGIIHRGFKANNPHETYIGKIKLEE